METTTVVISTRMNVTLRVDIQMGPEGAEVVDVRDVELPAPSEVMEALDAGGQFDELDGLFNGA